MHKSPGYLMFDICDGTICETCHILNQDDKALQIIAYYDDFTAENPLSSRARKNKFGMLCKFYVVVF